MTYGPFEPSTVSYTMARSIYHYIKRMLELGAIEGPLGGMHVSKELEEVVSALHHVLAGGSVKIKIEQRGNPDIVRELDHCVTEGTEDANAINKAAGYYVSLAP